MSFPGWMVFAGTEIINVDRTISYASSMLPSLRIDDCYDCGLLAQALQDPPYATPLLDGCEWYDADTPESAEFLGLYPLEVTGLTDSTRSAEVTEGNGDGGFVSRPRRATREVRVTGLLLGMDAAAVEFGKTWLKNVLNGSDCDGGCDGDEVCFFIDCPPVDGCETEIGAQSVVDRYQRSLQDVTCIEGPTEVEFLELPSGGAAMKVEFTMVAATPWVYGTQTLIATAHGAQLTSILDDTLIFKMKYTPAICGPVPILGAVRDPDCPPVPSPPRPLYPSSVCKAAPTEFFTYAIYVPQEMIPGWQDTVATLRIGTGSTPVRHMRVRFLPRPLAEQLPSDLDPCSACSAFVVNYIPPSSVMSIDGLTERITVDGVLAASRKPVTRNAAHLVDGMNGTMFQWPVLSCGIGYYVIVDVDVANVASIEMSLATRE